MLFFYMRFVYKKELIIGVDSNYYPMTYQDNNNHFQEFNIELAIAVFSKINYKCTFQPIDNCDEKIRRNGMLNESMVRRKDVVTPLFR